MPDSLIIYGANGYTGRLLARAAQQRGLAPVLCGRSEPRLRQTAEELGLEFRVAGLDDPRRLDAALDGMTVVLNAAGPFADTAFALVDACIRSGAHYLDVAGEAPVLEAISQRGAAARRRGVMLMPAVGFDVVPSDCLAAHAVRRSRRPVRLFIGLSGLTLLSRGSALTYIRSVADPVWVRRGGALSRVPPASLKRSFDFGHGPRPSIVVSWGDVSSAYFTTGIPDITVYFEATPAIRAHSEMLKLFGWAVPFTPWREWLKASASWMPDGPTDAERAAGGATISAEIESADGELVRSRLFTEEPYTCTAIAATAIARRVLAGDWEPGFETPARVFGADFVLSLPGVSREDA